MVRKSIEAIKRYLPKCTKSSFINKNIKDIRWKLIFLLLVVSFDVENWLGKFWLQSVRRFSSNPIPKLNGVLFSRRNLARWKQLNLSFFLIKSNLYSHNLQLWWKFLRLIDGNSAFKHVLKSSYLRPIFPGFTRHHLNLKSICALNF